MHLWDQPSGFYGSVPIVAGTVPLAVGAGMAAKMKGEDGIGVAYIGDGAAEEGVVHESLNFARVQNAPVLLLLKIICLLVICIFLFDSQVIWFQDLRLQMIFHLNW